jgi:hypothetical protein
MLGFCDKFEHNATLKITPLRIQKSSKREKCEKNVKKSND